MPRILCILLMCLIGQFGLAQSDLSNIQPNPENDFGMWWSASFETKPFRSQRIVEKQFYRKFRLEFQVAHRRVENLLWSQQTFLQLAAKYRIKKWFRVAATYRYSIRDKYSMNTQRIVVDLNFRRKIKRFSLRYRFRYQHNFGPLPPIPDLKTIRNRIALHYNIRKFPIDPYISAEVFTSFQYLGTNFEAVRYQIGAGRTFNKIHSIDLRYIYQRQIGVDLPVYRNIISISYDFTLK